jgi:tRNA-2-methylthio-N6-dimethylallyladenosine synthase
MSKRLFIRTYGCQMNERDSEIIEQLLSQVDFVATDCLELADMIVINTCSVRAKAEQKVYSLLGQLREHKARQADFLIAVAGCVAQQEGQRIFDRMPHVDMVVGTQQLYQLPNMVQRIVAGETRHELATDLSASFQIPLFNPETPPSPAPRILKKFVNIMQGCNNFCSYCVVPYTRGREVSRSVVDILNEVRTHVDAGVQEITLLGQNVNSYGQTNPVADHEVSFSELLRQVAVIPGLRRLRFTTSHPKDLSEELMRCFAELDVLCPHFHLPVQSGSDAVLKRMNRKYTRQEYLAKVEALLTFRPDLALATDIIVGFPGESAADFAQTMDLLRQVRFHGSFSFKYSDRPNTPAADYAGKVDEKTKASRLQAFQELQDQISLERNQAMVGTESEILVEHCSDKGINGRTPSNHIVHLPSGNAAEPGDLLKVRLVHAGKHSLQGVPLK